ncbi:MAG: Mur ligase domain-containing protein [Kiritimatiellaeota bacterium]|nr:Mur ligase domain-containing protein [Kiritimatiellota bacterium]
MIYHLIGIGGVGMSPLAEALLDAGHSVSGSDRFSDVGKRLPVFEILESQGAKIYPQDGSGITREKPDFVVRSTAIENDNPDVVAALAAGIPIIHRSIALAEAITGKRLIAIAGTCGKSTITGMVGHILAHAGFSPTVVNGAPTVAEASCLRTGSVLRGTGALAVIEVDESDKSLLNFTPEFSLVSNSSPDHFTQSETDSLFDTFLAKTTGAYIDGRQLPPFSLKISLRDWGSDFTHENIRFTLNIPGRHNAVNAWQAARLAQLVGVPLQTSADALAKFRGIKRRMELIGTTPDGTRVIDEYAHNTEKIRAALLALQPLSPQIIALWRPHGYGPLASMMDALETMFAETLRPSDTLILPPVFDAGGTARRDVQSDILAARLAARGCDAVFVPDYATAQTRIQERVGRRRLAEPSAIILIMGARDPDLPVFAQKLLN